MRTGRHPSVHAIGGILPGTTALSRVQGKNFDGALVTSIIMNSLSGIGSAVSARRFRCHGGISEWHVVINGETTGNHSVKGMEARWLAALRDAGIPTDSTILRRVFCSDVVNQHPHLDEFSRAYPGAFSLVGQSPAAGARFAMWSYHIMDPEKPPAGEGGGAAFTMRRGSLRHAWSTGLCDATGANASSQGRIVMKKLDQWLEGHGMTLQENVVRTWWFVRDIDADYQALVDARKAVFDGHGLTEDTHYIASTGIAGAHHEPTVKLSLDTYAISGLLPEQVEHLSAPEHLGPTHRYGVTFERATAISYADRKHVFISGTASIDPTGAVVHPGDVVKQLDRALENVAGLLAATGARLHDLAMMIVYVRDPADGPLVDGIVRQRLANVPMVIVHAPVCRPGWLVEVEGIACIPVNEPGFPEF